MSRMLLDLCPKEEEEEEEEEKRKTVVFTLGQQIHAEINFSEYEFSIMIDR